MFDVNEIWRAFIGTAHPPTFTALNWQFKKIAYQKFVKFNYDQEMRKKKKFDYERNQEDSTLSEIIVHNLRESIGLMGKRILRGDSIT